MKCFLTKHKGQEFYALALDCNAEYANFLVCMNAPEDFDRTLKRYQKKDEEYQDEKYIYELRYNPGDWEYTDISVIDLFGEEELAARHQDDLDTQCKEMMTLFEEILCDFRNTKVFAHIPKTTDFVSFCIDHDKDAESALNRQSQQD